jgi:fibronectin-binding autotransporter adhesin
MTRKRKSVARQPHNISSRRQASSSRPGHKALNRRGIMHAVWLMMLAPLPASAQLVEFLPDLSGSGTVNVPANSTTIVGIDPTGTQSFSSTFSGVINIDPAGVLAKAGSGTFTIDGSTITGGQLHILDAALAQTSGNTKVNYLSVGSGSNPFTAGAPSVGALNVSGGTITFGSAMQIGDFGGTGAVNQTGGKVVFGGSGVPVSLNIGNQGGSGTYNLSGGTLEFDGSGTTSFIVLGRNGASSSASAQQSSAGVLNLSGAANLLVTDGTLFIGSNGSPSSASVQPGSGVINQMGGTLTINSDSRLFLAATGNGTYNLNGGTLQIGGSSLNGDFNNSGGTYAFNLGGGTIQVIGSPLIGTVAPTLVAGTTSTIDTNGIGAAWSGVLSGGGALAKTGAGTLTLSAANTYTGGTLLNQGTLRLANAAALGSGTLSMAAGTTLDFAQSYTLTQQIKVSGDPTINVNAGLTSTLAGAIGDGSSSGDLVKTGNGVLVLSAPNTYTGATTISGGTLALSGAGSIATSSVVTANSLFDISAATADQSIRSLAGSGAVALGARSLTLTVANDSFSGTISGSGGLTLAGGHEILSGASSYTGATTITGGELQVDGSLAGSAVAVTSGGTLSGSGNVASVVASAGSAIAPAGQQVGTLTVNGNFNQAAGSNYLVQLAPGNLSDLIAVNGTATLASGAVLDIGQPETGVYVPGARYTVLSALGGVNGIYTLAGATSISAFLGVAATYDADHIYLSVQQTGSLAAAALTPNQKAVSSALDALPRQNLLFDAVASLPTLAAARTAFDQLSGEIHASVRTVLLEQSDAVRDAATDRLREAFCGAGSTDYGGIKSATVDPNANGSACNPTSVVVWQRAFGAWGNNSGGDASRLTRSIGGVLFGADTRVFNNWRVGMLAGYDHASFDVDGLNSSGSSDDYHLGMYGGTQWGNLGLRLGASYTWSNLDTDRSVALADYADHLSARYDAGTAQVFSELGYRMQAGRVMLEPFANLAYVNLHIDGYNEQGNTAALSGESENANMAFSTLGVRASSGFEVGKLDLTADGSLGWRHVYGNPRATVTQAFGGAAPFSVTGLPIARDGVVLEAGVGAAVLRNLSVGVYYTGQFGNGSSEQGVMGNLTWHF